MNKKTVLFIAFLLPGLTFLFLKKCTHNEYNIPVMYELSTDSLNAVCHTHYPSPYSIPDSVLQKIQWKPSATVFVFGSKDQGKELRRLTGSFDAGEFNVRTENQAGSENRFAQWMSCVFFVPLGKNAMLIDDKKRIRGYYDLSSFDETDRLIVEMKILLKKY